jgi:HAD superfamily hydrolase (TIGR01458 family)
MTKNNLINMLSKMGFSVTVEEIFAAPHAAVEYCKLKGYKNILLIVPDEEMKEDFSTFQFVDENPEAIVVGDMGKLFTFELLNRLFLNIINGAELIAMHKNRYWNSADGLTLDLGAFISALEYASGKSAIVVGKPDPNLFKLAVHNWGLSEKSIYVVGDDLDADIMGAHNAGMKSVLVKTGKFREENLKRSEIKPDYIMHSVADLPNIFQLN